MSLLYLPQEILMLIISELRHADDLDAMAKLCQTSKTVCARIQPELFRQFPKCRYFGPIRLPSYRDGMGTLMFFIKTVIERPELGACVRELVLETFNHRFGKPGDKEIELQKDSMEIVLRAYNHLPAHWRQRYPPSAVGIRTNPLLMLLITLTPNLEALELHDAKEEGLEGLELLWERRSQGIRRSGYLSNLKKLGIFEERIMTHKSMKNLIHLMRLPKLDEFYMTCADEHAPGCPPFDRLRPESLSITILDLVRCTFHQTTMRQLVRACKRLKVFCFSWAVYRTCTHDSRLKRSDIVSVLEPHQSSLEHMVLDFEDHEPIRESPDESQYASFTAFTSLKVLMLEQCGIQDVADLPDSLERLELLSCNRPVYAFLASLISTSKNGRLRLKSFRIEERWFKHTEDQNLILGIRPTHELKRTEEGELAMMEACRRLDDLIKTADFSVEIIFCSAWKIYVAEQETIKRGAVADNTA
ncbi:hypothetical protein AbraIFM66950_004534 [Aspergillus brasiliensis]|nr:hypothetical protein AbraIFM66950_004534 [Aspergillus brasiliensis]